MQKGSRMPYCYHECKSHSECGEHFDIEVSSEGLEWDEVILEKGSATHFYTENVSLPYYYFAVAKTPILEFDVVKEGSRKVVMLPSQIWILPPNTPFTHSVDKRAEFILFAFSPKVLQKYIGIDIKKLQFISDYNVVDESLKSLIELFLLEVEKKGVNGREYFESLLRCFAIYFVKNYSNFSEKERVSSEIELEMLEAYISENISESIEIEALAKLFSMSKFTFLKHFKQKTGITPYQYILEVKMSLAKNILKAGKKSIAEISFELGFSDQSHFSNVFKKYFDVTPKEYQRQMGFK